MKTYTDLLQEIEALKRENAELKARLSEMKPGESITATEEASSVEETASAESEAISGDSNGSDGSEEATSVKPNDLTGNPMPRPKVNRFSRPEEKIALFRSLFVGRTDVFARRWQSKSTGKSGYQPVCGNEWDAALCDKKKYKCADCPNRKLMPLTDSDIYNHLAGKDSNCRDVVGIYPMLPDETCCFCCLDFDEGDYQAAARMFQTVCRQWNVPAYIERSRSGEGAHVWIFFAEAIPAKNARGFASALLTRAMEQSDALTFRCYDRMFPNQDTLPQGGFGNLIALPLQGQARKRGNSVFVDATFQPYDDLWAFLSNCETIDASHVAAVFSKLGKTALGCLVESDETPWKPEKAAVLTGFDFPAELQIVRANQLYIPKDGLSANAKNRIRRLAAFRNPDFYRAQAMRMPVYNKPRIISCAEEEERFLILPRGCEEALVDLLDIGSVNYAIRDETNAGTEISVAFNGVLREEQQPAAEALLAHRIGVLSATTAFGKTVIAANLIAQRQVNTLILVHTQALMAQWKKALEQFLTFDIVPPEPKKGRGRKRTWSPVGLLGAGKHELRGTVDVAVMQSLLDGDGVKDIVRNYGMVIVDECHHVSAVNFEAILRQVNARYVYGLTATPTRHDGHHPIIFMQCGPIRYRVDAKAQAEKRPFAHTMIPRFTSFRKRYPEGVKLPQIYDDLMHSELRNQRIIEDVVHALAAGKTPLILTERKEHVATLSDMLDGKCDHLITLTGGASAKEKREALLTLEQIPNEDTLAVIATGKYVGEGFDYPRFDTLFLALPISWKGKLAQYAGRLHRTYPGKTEVLIYDYADIHIPMLETMYQRRLKGYASIGYCVKLQPEAEAESVIYDGRSFYPVFLQELRDTHYNITIVSPFLRMNRLRSLQSTLCDAVQNGIALTVVTRPPEDFADSDAQFCREGIAFLESLGVHVKTKTEFHQKFTVIDDRIVWYGSINFLSFGKAEESILRFESPDLANALLDTVL